MASRFPLPIRHAFLIPDFAQGAQQPVHLAERRKHQRAKGGIPSGEEESS
jgi:hypothetical protein